MTTTYTAAPGTGQLLGYARVSTGHQSLDQQSDALHAPPGDFCHGLLHPDLMGPNGFRDLPIGIDGLYLGGAAATASPSSPDTTRLIRCSTTSADVSALNGWAASSD